MRIFTYYIIYKNDNNINNNDNDNDNNNIIKEDIVKSSFNYHDTTSVEGGA